MKKRRMKIFYMMAMSTVIATTGVTGTMGTLRVSAAEIQMKSSVTTPKGVADFGRGNASITIQGNEGQSLTGKKFNVYKIFDAENSVGGESINYTLNSMYADSVKTVVGKKLNKAGNQVTEYEVIDYIQSLNKNQVEGAKTDQKLEGSYSDYRYFVEELRNQLAKDKKDADQVTVSATKSDNSCIIGGLEYGYYIVDEVSEVGGTHSAASLCIVNTANPEAEVNIKSDYPTVIKKIQEDDDQAKVGNEGWNDIADYEIGQNVPYKYESTMPNANGYDTYYYAWHDKMDEALTFDKNSVSIKIYADGSESSKSYTLKANASASDNSKVGTLKTNANGESNILTLNAGTYYVKELKAPKGYALDAQIKKITVASGTTTTVSFADQPQMDTIDVLVRKVDADTDKSKPQGNATLKGAEFTVKFYDGNYKADPAEAGKNPLRTWVFKTDQDGMCKYDTKYQVSGDDLYMTSKGNAAMPLGTITIQETKAPEGYLINSKIYVEQITSKGTPESVDTYNQPNVPDNVLKLELVKRQEGAEITIPEAVFEHTEPNGNTEKLTTDQNGKLTIKGLTYGVHKLKEISVMDGYVVNGNSVEFRVETDNKITLISKTDETLGKITFTVTEQGTVSMIVEDKLAPFQIQVHKENEKGLVLENAEFTLYSDKECTKEVAKLKTDEKGVVTFADLKVGQKYYLKETKAPQGYRIPVDGNGNPYFYEVEVTSNPVNDEFKIFINGREVDSSDGIFTLTGTKADRIVSMKVINMTGKKLPETGSNQMLFFIFAAFVAGIITVMMKKRKL